MTTITVPRVVLEQALEALSFSCPAPHLMSKHAAAEAALRAALEQSEQEPVAWMTPGQDLHLDNGEGFRFSDWTPLYTHPPRREWRELSDQEISDGREQLPTEDLCSWSFRKGVEFAEVKLKERNA